ncbi:MAG: ABC transporter permease, partial [Thermoanaerobaculia bacterium]
MESLKRAIRSLRQSPLVAVPSILSLALGIGVTTALFSVLNTALLKPLPVRDPQSVVVVYTQDAKNPGFLGVSYPNLRDLREKGDAFAELAAFQWTTLGLSGNAEPEQIFGQVVSGNYFDLLGIRMAHGRGFLPEEDRSPGAQPVVVLSHSLWARRYGADPSMVGRQVVLNRQPYTVVGVAPPEFRGTDVGRQPQLWVPLMMYPVAFPYPYNTWVESRRAVMFNVLARLRPGTDLAGTEARANGLAHRLEEQYPEDNRGRSWKLVPLAQATINPAQRGAVVGGVGYLLGAATLVLLLACANVASLQLGRLIAQRKDIAIQVALGASRWRVVRNFLVESLLPSALACVLGLLIALLGLRLLTTIRPPTEIPTSLEVAIDSRVLLFALGLTLLVTLLLGLTPILQVVGTDLVSALKGAVRVRRATGAGLQGLLVAVQAGLSCFCLLAATLFLTSLAQAERADPGFEAGHLAVVSFNAGAQGQPEEDVQDFYRRVVERVEALPGVRSAALATAVPLSGGAVPRTVFLEGQSENLSAGGVLVQVDPIGVDYFQTLGIALEAGRTFSRDDRKETEPVAVINRAMAERFWAGRGAIGKRFRFFGEESYLRVVG